MTLISCALGWGEKGFHFPGKKISLWGPELKKVQQSQQSRVSTSDSDTVLFFTDASTLLRKPENITVSTDEMQR